MSFKPLLAAKCETLDTITFPVYVSGKLDGIRATVLNGQLVSRTLKPIPNQAIRELFSRPEFEGLDGELIVGSPTAPDVFNKTTSQVMTRSGGAENVRFYVFDKVSGKPFHLRYEEVGSICLGHPDILTYVKQVHCMNLKFLQDVEEKFVEAGFEGIMIRVPYGKYKFGRSTLKEQILLKFKRFETSEAEVLGFEELMHNDNEATKDELGHTKRSSHQENQRPAGTLGALLVRDIDTGVEFKIGTGFDAEQRQTIWNNQPYFLNRVVSYQHFPIGVVDKPRFPSYRGVRDKIDMGE